MNYSGTIKTLSATVRHRNTLLLGVPFIGFNNLLLGAKRNRYWGGLFYTINACKIGL